MKVQKITFIGLLECYESSFKIWKATISLSCCWLPVFGLWCSESEMATVHYTPSGGEQCSQRCYRLHNCGRCQNLSGAVTSLSPDSYRPLHPPLCSPPVAREIDIFCSNQYRGFLDSFIISIFLQAAHSWHSSRCVNY